MIAKAAARIGIAKEMSLGGIERWADQSSKTADFSSFLRMRNEALRSGASMDEVMVAVARGAIRYIAVGGRMEETDATIALTGVEMRHINEAMEGLKGRLCY